MRYIRNRGRNVSRTYRRDPPVLNEVRWNRQTVELVGSGSGSVTIGAIETALKNQIGMQDSLAEFEVRVLSLHSYVMSNEPQKLSVDIYEYTRYPQQDDPSIIKTLEDWSGRNGYANIHYSWSAAVRNTLAYNNNTPVYAVRLAEDVESVDRVVVLWRVSQSVATMEARRILPRINERQHPKELTQLSIL